MTSIAPAPWSLEGSGYILLCRFSEEFIKNHAHMDPRLLRAFNGGLGTLMLVDYQQSNVGPYQELLLIPGRLRLDRRGYFHIPQIYVSSQDSIDNGRKNWGIPKRLATFKMEQKAGYEEIIVTSQEGSKGRFQFKPKGPRVPFTTALLPKAFKRLIQFDDADRCLLTQISGSGKMQWLKVQDINIEASLMAPVSKQHVLAAIKVPDFKLCFPTAEELDKQQLALSVTD
ncbi:acetoacetate decarboxylase family protein [Bermanella marisrubri]|nr:acetoacetate decarboxylase family protein [Bermanella marisrubri]QIZ83624.1 acetoacetate decarboxylase family protein [Bermanella marisrubri]